MLSEAGAHTLPAGTQPDWQKSSARCKADFRETSSSELVGWGLPQNLSGLPPPAQLLQSEVVRYQRLSFKDVPEHK